MQYLHNLHKSALYENICQLIKIGDNCFCFITGSYMRPSLWYCENSMFTSQLPCLFDSLLGPLEKCHGLFIT